MSYDLYGNDENICTNLVVIFKYLTYKKKYIVSAIETENKICHLKIF